MIIALNHKSNLDREEYLKYMDDFSKIETKHQLIVCPSFINLGNTNSTGIVLGSQNVSTYDNGAHTGEISVQQLKSYNVKYCIVGHSERRKEQKESLSEIQKKIIQLLQNDITPILCIGEKKKEREDGKVEEILKNEIVTATESLTKEEKEKLIIAYEPIWSIGTGLIPSNKDIKKTVQYIKRILPNTKVLYGGSVTEENIEIIKNIPNVDGYLLGGLSLKLEKLQLLLNRLN